MRRHPLLPAVLVVAVAVAVSVAVSACGAEGAGERVRPSSPTVAPESGPTVATPIDIEACPESGAPLDRVDGLPALELPCLGPGDPVQLAGLEGRPRLVNIWASWCGPCRDEMPWLQRAHASGAVDVLGVDAEDRAEYAAALISDLHITFPSVFDPANELARELRIVSKPTTLLVSAEGEVVYVHPGPFASYADLRRALQTHLKVELP